jgi:hypothetical protein
MRFRCWLVLPAGLIGGPAFANEPFHSPQSKAERALDAILKMAGKDGNQLDNLFDGRGDPSFHKTVDYTRFLTRSLLSAIADRQKQILQQDCGGRYTQGELCGMDYSPINCAQDVNRTYVYRTEKDNDSVAEITYAWPGQKPAATYRLVLSADHWKLDGIRCVEGDNFDMK